MLVSVYSYFEHPLNTIQFSGQRDRLQPKAEQEPFSNKFLSGENYLN